MSPMQHLRSLEEEPRHLTTLVSISYVTSGIAGSYLAFMSTIEQDLVAKLAGALLILAALLGIVPALLGIWYIERFGALLQALGSLFAIAEVATTRHDEVDGALIIATFATIIASALVRYIRTSQMPYAPGKGPLLPTDWARLQEGKQNNSLSRL